MEFRKFLKKEIELETEKLDITRPKRSIVILEGFLEILDGLEAVAERLNRIELRLRTKQCFKEHILSDPK